MQHHSASLHVVHPGDVGMLMYEAHQVFVDRDLRQQSDRVLRRRGRYPGATCWKEARLLPAAATK